MIKQAISIPAHINFLADVRNFIKNIGTDYRFSSRVINSMMLAVEEACTNIIKHAYKSSPDGEILLTINYDENKFTITIIDYGKSFEPNTVPLPDLQKYYKEHKVGGLGIYLMKSLMDDVKYTSVPGKYNRVFLSKDIKGS